MGSGVHTDKSAESRRRIIESAKGQIEQKGILGLRVQDVAHNAGVSVPLIYKYFGDRDGLLADVLSEMFVDCSTRHLGAAAELLVNGQESISVDQLVQAFVLPKNEQVVSDRALALQIFAASSEIPALAERLAQTEREIHSQLNMFIADTFNKLGLDDSVPVAALSMLIQSASLGFVFNDSLGDLAVADEEFAQLVRVLIQAIVDRHSTTRS